jgi:hypothetical protein
VRLFGVSPCVYLLTVFTFRLNSRDYIRGRSSPDNSDNSFNLSSIRVAPPGEAFGSKSKQTDISVLVRRSTASVHAQNKSDPNMGPCVRSSKTGTMITLSRDQIDTYFAEGHKYHSSKPSRFLGPERIGS